jgi:hypothetical protein
MLIKKLFDNILIDPAETGCNNLHIVSGYATSAMAFHHIQSLLAKKLAVNIHLLVGMCPQDGLSETNHKAFQQLAGEEYPDNFECSYVTSSIPVHSKVYSWCKDDKPLHAFVGSANYTQNAFKNSQMEAMSEANPKECRDYFDLISKDSIYCTHQDAETSIRIYNDEEYFRRRTSPVKGVPEPRKVAKTERNTLPSVKISFLDRHNNLPSISGLNWGQRPKRNHNQAYIRIPLTIARTEFFPEIGSHFTVLTDDEKILTCTRAQQKGKAIETPQNNSLLGEYFRNRLGLPNGAFITTKDLRKYGRTNVDFYKIDDETYHMDFSNIKG